MTASFSPSGRALQGPCIVVIEDSVMLLNFVREVLEESNYQVIGADTGEQGLRATRENKPDLVILDHALPDLRGEEVSERLAQDAQTASIPVIFMSGFVEDDGKSQPPNVVGFLSKPFTADLLLNAIEEHVSHGPGSIQPEDERDTAVVSEFASVIGPETPSPETVASGSPLWGESAALAAHTEIDSGFASPPAEKTSNAEVDFNLASSPDVFFAGDTNFFSLNWALRTIGGEKLTGMLRCFWPKADVELFARDGKVLLVTTRDPEVYCSEAPITLVNIDSDRVAHARSEQSETSCPLFLTLAREDLIMRDAALQLVQHYGQKLFAQLWGASRVRFVFQQVSQFPDFVDDASLAEDVDQWTLAAVRFVQPQDVADKISYDPNWIPAYTRDGFERVQNLRLTVAEAQFASQFNGTRSIAQIARNLRLDMKLARLTLFRFVALEVVECWPPTPTQEVEQGGLLKRLGRKIGLAE